MSLLRTREAIRRLALVISVVPLLASCQATAPSAQQAQPPSKTQLFVQAFSETLRRNGVNANAEGLSGSFNMIVKVNRKNEVVGCATEASKNPKLQAYPYNVRLARLMAPLCWSSVFPEVPLELFGSEQEQVVVAPLVFLEMPKEMWQAMPSISKRYATAQFFWKNLLAKQPLDSVGIAYITAIADTQGTVQTCTVRLKPHPNRPLAFKPDEALTQRLTEQCKQLDLAQVPGFRINPDGNAGVVTRVEYTPWRGRGDK